jgi:hypothetical protein
LEIEISGNSCTKALQTAPIVIDFGRFAVGALSKSP